MLKYDDVVDPQRHVKAFLSKAQTEYILPTELNLFSGFFEVYEFEVIYDITKDPFDCNPNLTHRFVEQLLFGSQRKSSNKRL